jgi:ribose transport system ATP-binding protein
MANIVKHFAGTVALNKVTFDVVPGEIHALLGENGAGKSTLIKILTGVYKPDKGDIHIKDKKYSYIPIKELDELGIAVVHQDLKLAPDVSIAENILMGRLPLKSKLFVDHKKVRDFATEALQKVGLNIDPSTPVNKLKAADQVIVAIAKALSRDAKVLILDEPTAILVEKDVQRLFMLLRDLVSRGVAIIYISHRLEEIFSITDRVTVLRDGQKVWTRSTESISKEELIEAIAGQIHTSGDTYYEVPKADELLKVEKISKAPYYQDISFQLNGGEVVGLYGLVGGGKSELLKGIFGELPIDKGQIYFESRPIKFKSSRYSIKHGIGYVPEDRKTQGFLPRLPIYINANVPGYRRNFARYGWVKKKDEKNRALSLIKDFKVKYSNLDQDIADLSGGNQQKVVVAKWMGENIKILLLDEPTAGIDVGARRDIFIISRKLASEGKSVLYCSSYLPELIEVADRILVMSKGSITGVFSRKDGFKESELMNAAYK